MEFDDRKLDRDKYLRDVEDGRLPDRRWKEAMENYVSPDRYEESLDKPVPQYSKGGAKEDTDPHSPEYARKTIEYIKKTPIFKRDRR